MKIASSSSLNETCDKVSKISLYVLVFLLPILFLPWTANVLDFNKQAALILLVFISIFAWMLKILISGKASFNFSVVHLPVIVLFLVYAASTIFSLWRYGSFWGWPGLTSESLISLLALVLLYFLIINIFKRKEIFYVIFCLILSGFLSVIYGLFQLFGKYVIPIGFTKSVSFNTIGGVNGLAVFVAVLLPLIIIALVVSKQKGLRILFVIAALLSAALLLLINFQIAWWLVIAGCALIIAFGTQKRDIFDNRWLVLPMFFLAVALLFSFFRFQIPGTPERPVEVFLTHRASFNIAFEALKNSPVVGSGPGTFINNFSKFKDISFNNSSLWDMRFDWASSKALTIMGTVGILGILSFLALMGFFIFYGIKFLFTSAYQKEEEGQELFSLLGLGIFISFLTLTIGFFLFKSNLSLDFVYFVLMGCFVSLLYPAKKEIILKPSSLVTLAITFGFTLIFIFGLGVLILEGQRYASAVSYLKGMETWQAGKTAETLKHLETAVRISPQADIYWREIAQVYLRAMSETAVRTDLSQAEVTRQVQLYINSAVNAAKAATETDPNNVVNWSSRGIIYQNLIGIVGGTKDWAVSAYGEALKLEPANPYFPTQAGISILTEASRLGQDKTEERTKLLTEAEEKFNEAIRLKADYAAAHFQLAIVYQAQGKQAEMISQLEKTKSIAPFDVGLAFQLGLIYYQMGDFQKAQIELERTIVLNNNYANALYFLGLVYDELGQKELAIKVFERVLANNPDNGLVIQILKNLRAGEKALKGIAKEQTPVVPIEEKNKEE
jgi:tetratricopeptide (TPR) repeat protein